MSTVLSLAFFRGSPGFLVLLSSKVRTIEGSIGCRAEGAQSVPNYQPSDRTGVLNHAVNCPGGCKAGIDKVPSRISAAQQDVCAYPLPGETERRSHFESEYVVSLSEWEGQAKGKCVRQAGNVDDRYDAPGIRQRVSLQLVPDVKGTR